MFKVYPDYYKDFRCIGGSCSHNCCIGWEIDIDEKTSEYYRSLDGAIGKRIRENIAWEDESVHFILGDKERCPFLNKDNLCDIITTLGEEHLCSICQKHPRFENELPGRVEIGIGLCCEEACRLILGRKETVSFGCENSCTDTDEIIALRNEVILHLQNRNCSIDERIEKMLCCIGAELPERTLGEWAEFFLTLERLDDAWTDILELVRDSVNEADYEGFWHHMSDRQHEYEQLLVYFVYRHMACATDLFDAASRGAFAVLGYKLIYGAGAYLWTRYGKFTFEDQSELVRLFSSEVEYSEDNLNTVFDELF